MTSLSSPDRNHGCDSHLSRSSIPLPFCCCDKCHDQKRLLEVGNRRQRWQLIIEGHRGRNGTEIESLSRKHGGTLLALCDAGKVHLLREWHGPQQSGSPISINNQDHPPQTHPSSVSWAIPQLRFLSHATVGFVKLSNS